jgi:hypothetical protein
VECEQLGVPSLFRSFIARFGEFERSAAHTLRDDSYSFLSGFARVARRHALRFIAQEGEDRGKWQWEERVNVPQARMRNFIIRKETGESRERRRRDLLGHET